MKTKSFKQVEAAKRRAELAAANLMGDSSRADEFGDMSVEEYAEFRGIKIENPKQKGIKMASRIKQLETELEEANARIDELEDEREGILEALGIEIVDEDDGDSDEGDSDDVGGED